MKNIHPSPVLWIISYLILIDVAVYIIFKYPPDPKNTSPSALQLFFEYGRSVEGKLSRMTRLSDEESASIINSGWILKDKREW
jgi:hypothetical protein